MTEATLASRCPQHPSTLEHLAEPFATRLWLLLREWHRRSRSRFELSNYSYHERADLGFAAELDAELSKPFWRK